MGDRDILEGNVELGGTAQEVGTNAVGNSFTLGDELGSIELGDDGLEDFVSDGGKDTLVVILSEVLIECMSVCDARRERIEYIPGRF